MSEFNNYNLKELESLLKKMLIQSKKQV